MIMHEKFLEELRKPVRQYNQKMNEYRQKKARMSQAAGRDFMNEDELMKEFEAKFDELFGEADDE